MINLNFIKLFMYLLFINFLGSLLLLFLGTQLLVNASITLSNKLSINRLVIGFTVVSLATSLPELFVTIGSSFRGYNDFAIGNIIGSNISNISLVLGCTALISPILFSKKEVLLNYVPLILTSVLFLLVLMIYGVFNLLTGVISVVALVGFNVYLLKKGRNILSASDLEDADIFLFFGRKIRIKSLFYLFVILLLGALVLWIGSELLINSSKEIALQLGVSDRVISITLVALGTSLPELFASIYAALKKETKLAIGNLLGSNIFNMLAVLGLTTCINDIYVVNGLLHLDGIIMLIITVLLLPCFYFRNLFFVKENNKDMKIYRMEGAILLMIYVFYMYFILF